MKRGLVQVLLSLVVFATCGSVMAEKPYHWETATVISQKLSPNSNTVVVDTGAGGHRYEWKEFTGGPDWHQFIVLTGHDQTVHEQVKFYRDGQWFVVLDDHGEKHKFSLIRATEFE